MPKYQSDTPEGRAEERRKWREAKDRVITNKQANAKLNRVKNQIEYYKREKPPKVNYKAMNILDKGELPDDIMETLGDFVEEFCRQHNIDDFTKAPAQLWSAACMRIGWDIIAPRGIILDGKQTRIDGVPRYDPEKVSKLIDIWAYMCSLFAKAPLLSDFCSFAHVTSVYVTGKQHDVSSYGTDIHEKVMAYQEAGLASRLVDGKHIGNPIGTIFFLKNWHGWKDQREIVHTDTKQYIESSDLPVLGEIPTFDDVPALPGEIVE